MILYEVTATLDSADRTAYESYMRGKHIPDVLASGCFVSARFSVSASGACRTAYAAATPEDLDRYLAEYANALRADFAAHFPEGVALTREVWTVIEDFTSTSS